MSDNNLSKINAFPINLATDQVPVYSINKTVGIIQQGKKNKQSDYILALFNNHSEHGAIVRGKADYVTGLNIKPKDENPTAVEFLKRANPFESWQELRKKYNLDRAIHGGYYLLVETNIVGTPINHYHLPYNSVRRSDDFCGFKVCDDWENFRRHQVIDYPEFKPGFVGASIYYYKEYAPAKNKIQGAYAEPEYMSCILDIDTDIRLGSFSNNFIKNNFSAGTMIIIPNGETDPKKKEAIAAEIKADNAGEDNAGNSVVIFTPKEGTKDVQILSLNANDLANQHSEVRKTNKEKIVAGHRVNGALFKVKLDDKALFTKNELADQHELFINEYAKVKQADDTKEISKWFKLKTGQESEFEIEQIKLIGLDLPLDNQNVLNTLNAKNPEIVFEYIKEKYDLKIPEKLDALGNPIVTPIQEGANDHLKNLTGRQFQGLMRIVNKYNANKITKETAIALMKSGFQVSDAEALTFLTVPEEEPTITQAVKQSAQDKNKRIEELFLKYCHPIQEGEVLEVIDFKKMNFADAPLTGRINELRNGILNQLKGNPFLTEQELAKQLGVETEYVKAQIKWLNEKGLIDIGEGTFQPTEKAMAKETEPFETEIITEYTYQKRPDVSGSILLPTSRPDCVKWVNLTRKNAITYEAIQKLKNEFGDSAWDFAGGFYNDNGEITPFCRHYWEGQTKIVRKK